MPHPLHHTASMTQEQALHLLNEVWEHEVVPRLPATLQQQAEALEVFERKRAFPNMHAVLRGLLAYVLGVYSFKQVGLWATLIGLASISDTAWRHWLLKASQWLEWLIAELLAVPTPVLETIPAVRGRILLIDATHVNQPGGKGGKWRLHQAYDLLSGRLCQITITDRHRAESLEHFALQPGDLVVADQAYGYRSSVAQAQQQQAQVVLRIYPRTCPLLQEDGSALEVLDWLRQLKGHAQVEGSRTAWCEWNGERYRVRVLVHRLSERAEEHARRRVRETARKKGYTPSQEALEMASWVVVITTLPEDQWSDEAVLRLYRARWQIELFFKRMKSIAQLAHIRCVRPAGVQATLRAWLVAWLLQAEEQAELRALLEAAGVPQTLAVADLAERPVSTWALTQLSVETLRHQVLGSWTYERVQACQRLLWRYLRWSPRKKRRQQELMIRAWLAPGPLMAHPPQEAVA